MCIYSNITDPNIQAEVTSGYLPPTHQRIADSVLTYDTKSKLWYGKRTKKQKNMWLTPEIEITKARCLLLSRSIPY
jgi:hypothetical protein